MEDKKPYLYLNAFLAKDEHVSLNTAAYLKESSQVNAYALDSKYELEGELFVKIPTEKRPKWSSFTENITGASLDELANRSSSAVLIIKTSAATMAFTFG